MVHASTARHRDDLHFQCGHPDRKGTGAAFEAALDRAFRDCRRAYTSGKDMLCHRSSLAEALQTVAKRCRSEAGQLFAAAGIGISMTGTGPFSAIWTQSVKESGLGRLLTEMEYAELLALATVLCSADPVQQRVLFQRYGEQFQDMSRGAQEQYREKGALYRKLAAAAGVFLVLLLI